MNEKLNDLAFRWFRPLVQERPDGSEKLFGRFNTPKLRQALLRANLSITAQEHIAMCLLFGVVGLVFGLVSLVALGSLSAQLNSVALLTIAVLAPFLLPLILFFSGLYYPQSRANARKRDIDYKLPYAVNFIAAMASANITPEVVFRGLARQKVYGEVQQEAARIMRDIDFLGHDLLTALHTAIVKSPSLKFQEFLQGAITTISTGGHLKPYFVEKATELMRDNRSAQNSFNDQLELISEAYVTLVVAAPLFVLVMLAVLLLLDTGNSATELAMLFAPILVYFIVPVLQIFFALLIRHYSPEAFETSDDIDLKGIAEEFWQALVHPTSLAITRRERDIFLRGICFLVTVGLVAVILLGWVIDASGVWNLGGGNIDYMIFIVLALLGPAAFYEERHTRRNKRIEETMGDFLRDLAESTRAGMTLPAAINAAAEGEYGDLTPEIKMMSVQQSWGITATAALRMLAERVRTPLVERSVALINESNRAGGRVADVLQTAAGNSKEIQMLAKEREMKMNMYTGVIYLAFIILIFVLMAIYAQFIPAVADATEATVSGEEGMTLVTEVDVPFFQTLFLGTILVQGFGGGLVAGVISRARFSAGFWYSFLMVAMGYCVCKIVYWNVAV